MPTKAKAIKNRCEGCGRSILPICMLVSMLTAILVTLFFSVTFTSSVVNMSVKGKYENLFRNLTDQKDENGFTFINPGAIVDMTLVSNESGLIFITENSCTGTCEELAVRIAKANEAGAKIYRYTYSEGANDEATKYTNELLINSDSDGLPALVYIRDGYLYDRLDDIRSEADLNTFLGKYL